MKKDHQYNREERIIAAHYDPEAEEVVVGSLFKVFDNWPRALVDVEFLKPRMFTNPFLRRCFEISSSSDSTLDYMGIEFALSRSEKEKWGDTPGILAGIDKRVSSSCHLKKHAKRVHGAFILREKARMNNEFEDKILTEETETKELLGSYLEKVGSLISEPGNSKARPIGELFKEAVEQRFSLDDGETTFLQTGFPELDAIVRGLRPGELIILAARPSLGKTTFAMQIALQVAEHVAREDDVPVVFFSMEMMALELGNRVVTHVTGIPPPHSAGSYTTEEKETLRKAAEKSSVLDLPLWIDDTSDLKVCEIRRKVKMRTPPPGLIVVDYAQLLKGNGETKFSQMEGSIHGLKNLAKKLKIPIILLSQVNREGVDDPQLENLKYAGDQDADVVITLHYKKKEEDGRRSPAEKIIVKVLKNRNGPRGGVSLVFERGKMRFR